MTHALILDSEMENDAVFVCSVCGGFIGFNKPGIGSPEAVALPEGGWGYPDGPEQWMGPCEVSE